MPNSTMPRAAHVHQAAMCAVCGGVVGLFDGAGAGGLFNLEDETTASNFCVAGEPSLPGRIYWQLLVLLPCQDLLGT